ncbi:uncharacterized protein [Bombus fervidus]|uniref:uncharacterized protein n=1 Tax=Bombus fervidus TaxID=203811 RepID=UPI003D18B70B
MFLQYWTITLAIGITTLNGFKITPIDNNGIFHEKISKEYLYGERINVIIGIDISTVLEQVRYTENGVAEVKNHCETQKDCTILPEIRSLQAKLNNVRTLSIKLQSLAHIHLRNRRGLIDAIGSISKTLFGTLDVNDLDVINKNIDKLFEEGNSLKTIVADQTALIKRILNNDVIQQLKRVDTGITNELRTLNKNEITLLIIF